MDTAESESEEGGDEEVENQEGEGKIVEGENNIGSREEGETTVNVEGHESSQTGEDKGIESEEERVEEQDVEVNAGSEEESKEEEEGKQGEVGGENADGEEKAESDKDDGERSEEGDGEKESVPVDGEEVGKKAVEEEMETEIVLLDDVETDGQETPRDERSTRRHFRRSKKHDDGASANRAKRLRLEDIEETEESLPLAQETLAAEKDVSPKALETRYEAEKKRKGKHAAKPQKKKPHQASTTVVINEATPETIRVPFAHPAEDENKQEEMMLKLGANTLQQEILLKLNEEAVAQRGLMAAQADKMTQAVETMMKMVALVDQKILRVQQCMPPKLPTALEQSAPRDT